MKCGTIGGGGRVLLPGRRFNWRDFFLTFYCWKEILYQSQSVVTQPYLPKQNIVYFYVHTQWIEISGAVRFCRPEFFHILYMSVSDFLYTSLMYVKCSSMKQI